MLLSFNLSPKTHSLIPPLTAASAPSVFLRPSSIILTIQIFPSSSPLPRGLAQIHQKASAPPEAGFYNSPISHRPLQFWKQKVQTIRAALKTDDGGYVGPIH